MNKEKHPFEIYERYSEQVKESFEKYSIISKDRAVTTNELRELLNSKKISLSKLIVNEREKERNYASYREWFGHSNGGCTIATTPLEECINDFLCLYATALSGYFNVTVSSADEFIKEVSTRENPPEDEFFIEWLISKGLPYLKEFASKEFISSDKLIKQLEYVNYLLEEELDLQFKEELLTCLIDVVADMPERLDNNVEDL